MNMFSKLGVVTGALVLGAAGMAPAQAQRYVHNDAVGDVTQITCDETGDNCSEAPAVGVKDPDIIRTVVDHRARRVIVWAKFADITPTDQIRGQFARIKTNENLNRNVTLLSHGGQNISTMMQRPNGQSVRCRGLRATADYAGNTVTVSIPRTCLSRPRWVQAGFGSFAARDIPTDGGRYDDANVTGATNADNMVLGPRVRRG